MKTSFNLFLPACVFLLINCSDPGGNTSPVPEGERKRIESAVINRFNAMIKYAEAGELDNILMHFEPSGPGTYVDKGVQYPSLQDMIDNYRATWKISKQDYGVPTTKVYVLARDWVMLTSSSTLNTTTRENVVFQPRPWSLMTLWMLKDGEWYIHSFHQYEGDAKPVEQEQPANR